MHAGHANSLFLTTFSIYRMQFLASKFVRMVKITFPQILTTQWKNLPSKILESPIYGYIFLLILLIHIYIYNHSKTCWLKDLRFQQLELVLWQR